MTISSNLAGSSTTAGPDVGWSILAPGAFPAKLAFQFFAVLGFMFNLGVVFLLSRIEANPQLTVLNSLAWADLLESLSLLAMINYPIKYGAPSGEKKLKLSVSNLLSRRF